MIFLHENGVTVVATNEAKRGKVYELNGEKYYIARGVSDIKKIIDSKEHLLNRVITSKLTSLNGLFQIQGGYSQAAVPDNFNDDISNWDTSNVLSMEEVFSGWPKFNQDISNWDTSRVESMHGMFKSSKYVGNYYMGATSFNQDISNWDVSKVKNMSEMFLGSTSFNQDISIWDVSNVENMDHMFSGATSFNQPIGNWDTSRVESMHGIFSDVVAIGILAFVGTLEYTRAGSTAFNQPIGNLDVSNVKDMSDMFSGATSFNQDLSNWDVSNVENMNNMFSGGSVANNMSSLDNNPTSFNQPIGNWNISRVGSMNEMFSYATSFNQDLSNWDTSRVKIMSEMFQGATSFNQPIGNWDVSNVVNMNHIFSSATSFNQDLNGWDVSSLSVMTNMFYGATSFNAPISKWKVKSITDMENMFREATAFNQDISSWDVSNVTQMKGLFQDATSFNQNISNWKLNEKLPKSPTMFKDAKAFNIKEYNPFLNKKAKKRDVDISTANLSPEDKKTISKIKKFLVSRDVEKIDLGLELLISLNNNELFETLLHDCKIVSSPTKMIRNKLFTGSGPAQPYLDYALINVIANAPENIKKDESLLLKNITSFYSSMINLKVDWNPFPRFLPIDKFSSLLSLDIDLSDFKLDDIALEDVFNNRNITNLNIKNAGGSLKWLKNFSNLKVLEFTTDSGKVEDEEYFKYLDNLEELTFSSSKFKNLDFLAKCKKLKKLDLHVSYSSSSYSDDIKLESIDFLNKLGNLEDLTISGLNNYEFEEFEMTGLYSCQQIKKLTINISDSTDLEMLKNCTSLEKLNLEGCSNFDVSGKISEIEGLKGLDNLKSISLGDFNFFALENENLMTGSSVPVLSLESDNNIPTKALNGKSIVVTGVFENHSRDELKEIIQRLGGKPSSSVSKSTAFILSGSKMGPNKKLKAEELNIKIINEKDFIEEYVSASKDQQSSVIPFISLLKDEEAQKGEYGYVADVANRPKLSADDRKKFSEIKKLFNSRDYDKVDEGVAKLVSLNILELFETLLEGCEIHCNESSGVNSGYTKLIRNKFFAKTGPDHPYLSYALFSIIANAPQEASIHDSILHRSLSSLDVSVFNLSAHSRFIPIDKFSSLSSLTLDFKIFEEMNHGANMKISREDWFVNNNIIKLDIPSFSGSMKFLKNFSKLKSLQFSFGYYESDNIECFEYLENLEELSIQTGNYQKIESLDFLKNCNKLKRLNMSLRNSWGDNTKLKNIDVIKNFSELEELEISALGSTEDLNLDALLSCKKIRKLSLNFDSSQTRFDFKLLNKCTSLETLNLTGLNQIDICGKILDINQLNGLNNLKELSISGASYSSSAIKISALDSKVFIK